MGERYFPVHRNERCLLASGWQLCAAPPGLTDLTHLDTLQNWLTLPDLQSVASALRQAGLWSLNGPVRRFDAEDWWYRLHFDCPNHLSGADSVLGFDGLATLADVWLNGVFVLSSSNMFLQHRIAVGEHLKTKGNELAIVFRALDQHLTQRKPRPRWRVPMVEHQQLRWLRTTLLGRTPGWSPPVTIVGPWRKIWLEPQWAMRLSSHTLRATVAGSLGIVAIQCSFENAPDISHVELRLSRNNEHYAIALTPFTSAESIDFQAELHIDNVALWWPHTHGTPALYQAELHVNSKDLNKPTLFDLGTVGFRTITLIQDASSFSLQINGVPIFCRGACWTPLDPVTLDVTINRYQTAISQVCAAGMNMLRISGTMAYEADDFYQVCAEQGVMIWQDFMFASMDYPDDPAFLASVQQEAEQQLLCWHTCPALTVICGNSEVEQQAAMWGAARNFWTPPLFHERLANLSKQFCPDVPYWPSSTHGGSFPHQNDSGTTSYYGVGAYLRPVEDARRSAVVFATECLAFANVPELSNIEQIPSSSGLLKVHHPQWKQRVPRDLGAGWDFEDIRDHYLAVYFGVNPLQLRYADHERYLLLSRVVSGELMAATFNEWRCKFSSCQGGLIWLLRDLWPGAGWGVLDSDGHPKAAYYFLKRALQPLSLAINDEGTNGLYVHISNEHGTSYDVEITLSVYKSGQTQVASVQKSLTLYPRATQAYPVLGWFEHFIDLTYAYRFGPPIADAVHVQLNAMGDHLLSEAFYFPLGFTQLTRLDLGLQAQVSFSENGDAIVTVHCKRLALAVYFDVDGFIPDDAYFHLAPYNTKIVTLRPTKKRSVGLFGYIGAINATEMVTITTHV